MDPELKQYLTEMEHRLDAKLKKVETNLLTALHQRASPAEFRARSHAAAIRAMDLEMESIGDRVEKLEKRPDAPS